MERNKEKICINGGIGFLVPTEKQYRYADVRGIERIFRKTGGFSQMRRLLMAVYGNWQLFNLNPR